MEDLGKLIVAEGFKTFPKSNKSPNLVTLIAAHDTQHQQRQREKSNFH